MRSGTFKFSLSENVILEIEKQRKNYPNKNQTNSPCSNFEKRIEFFENFLPSDDFSKTQKICKNALRNYNGVSYWVGVEDSSSKWELFFAPIAKALNIFDVCGVEWWIRSQKSNTGKNFHFDKDEEYFLDSMHYRTPFKSSVLYLSDFGGETAILDLEAGHEIGQKSSYKGCLAIAPSHKNNLVCFPGELSHAVLPLESQTVRTTLIMNWWRVKPKGVQNAPTDIIFPNVDKIDTKKSKIRVISGTILTTKNQAQ